MDNLKLCNYMLKDINELLKPTQKLELIEQRKDDEEIYFDLKWVYLDGEYGEYEISDHVFGGDPFEIYIALNGIDYGLKMYKKMQ